MDRATDFAQLAAGTPCPDCGVNALEFVLRCDLEYHACLYTAHCRSCGMSFEIVTGTGEPDPLQLAAAVDPCEKCGSRERLASLHCEVATRTCVYTLRCPDCEGPGAA